MKKYLTLLTIILVVISYLVIPSKTYAQMPAPRFKKAAEDTVFSTINPVVTTIGVKSFVSGLRVPKGTGSPGNVSSSSYSNGMLKLSDTTFSTEEIVGGTISTVSVQNNIFVSCTKNQNAEDVSLIKKDQQENIVWSILLPSVSGNDLDQPLAMRAQGSNLFITGTCKSSDRTTAGFNAFVVKTDLNGNTIWTSFLEGFGATAIAPRSNGDVFVLVRGFISQNVYLLNTNGNIIWNSALPSGYMATTGCLDEATGLFVVAMKEDAAASMLAFLTVDGTGNVSSVTVTNQAGSIVLMEDSYAGFVVSGGYGGFGSNVSGAYGAEYNLSFSRLWVRKEASTPTETRMFTGLAKRHNGVGWILSGSRARDFYPSSTYDLLVTSVTYPPISNNVLISGSSTICSGDSTVLSVPYNDSLTYTWKRYGQVVGGNTNTLTVTQAGKYKLTVTTCYGVTKNSTDFFVTVDTGCRTVEPEVITEEYRLEELKVSEFNVYPNPVSGNELHIDKSSETEEIIELFDMTGRAVQSFESSSIKNTIDISGLNPGIYIVRIGKMSKRLVKE